MDGAIMELAKTDVRYAMRKEIQMNQLLIENSVVYRNTPRQIKIGVFTAMARNEVLSHFLNLDSSMQTPNNLKTNLPMSPEYYHLMYKIGATRYAHHVKTKAEHQLFLDYTHTDYRRKRHFLDEILPEQPKLSKIWGAFLNVVGTVLNMIREYWGIPLLVGFGLLIYFNHSSSPTHPHSGFSKGDRSSSGNGSTFGMNESTSIGNPDENSVSDTPQVIDDSNQTGFGNEGDSGYDSPSSANEFQTINNDSSKKISTPDVVSNETELTDPTEKSMFIKEGNPNFFTIGSPKQKVIDVMGTSTSMIGNSWIYGDSNVELDSNDHVIGWNNINHNLKVSIGSKKKGATPFTIGSSIQDVIDAMGTPTSIIGDSWGYDYSAVQLNSSGEEVIGWSNISDNLNVFMGPRIKTAAPFTKGSSKQQVIHAMGTPTSVIRDSWGYGFSTVQFDLNGKVSSWSNIDKNLKVTMNPK
ncbi:hypothetical protein C1I60_19285 [Paenibacillus terrae]|uniref:Uncharacterized protein n=1 Tax=Paenibacillus terrae TaxID=159743 RepID=A0A4U2PX64_9BACL|nr:hypothetical protein [Paenibacillus terrae]TKH41498.1 hypothetical protein C1I60_19285 [Paenibacillus terrae]